MDTDAAPGGPATPTDLPGDPWDVLVVGAGPTGLVLAAVVDAHGGSVCVVDRNLDRVHESRALAIQPRTLEVLRGLGVSDELVRRGNPAVRLQLHAGDRVARLRLFDAGLRDTAFPFLLFLAQSETEAVLGEHLARRGVRVERGATVEGLDVAAGGCTVVIRGADGGRRTVAARYVVGCDGARSTVRRLAGIPFVGGGYPQTFLLADLAADGLATGTAHAFLGGAAPFLAFPLERPAPWRIIAMRSGSPARPGETPDRPVTPAELQALADEASGGSVTLGEPVWATAFRLQHRRAPRYRAGRIFLAGDAAHIHSPAGAQGMNTGIQDAVNLGWKLALVARERAPDGLLDSYDVERRPVGEYVVRFTDRAFRVATSRGRLVRSVRSRVAPALAPVVLRSRRLRSFGFRTVGQLRVRYRHSSALAPARPWRTGPPRAGDRLPDAVVVTGHGEPTGLQEALAAPGFHLLVALRGDADPWPALRETEARHPGVLTVHVLRRDGADRSGAATARAGEPRRALLVDPSGEAFERLHVRRDAVLVLRPDGHLGYRGSGPDLEGARRYLARVLTVPSDQLPWGASAA